MNPIKKAYCRCFQKVFHIALPILPYRNPKIHKSLTEIPEILRKNKVKKPLIVTDQNLSAIGAVERLKYILTKERIEYALFDEVYPNPTTQLVLDATAVYYENHCDGVIAYGGGSPMDVAKALGVKLVHPHKSLEQMGGILKVHKRLPLIIAVPTTAGTGSETTLASVIVSSSTRHKFTINDFPLIPRYAILDPETIHTLPEHIGATTGLDALTHAVEAYIGRSTTKETRYDSEHAVKLIFENLEAAVWHESQEAEAAMLEAAHFAGRAFTRSYVGYIHAISHSLSGQYNLPHGWTNAVLLPIILRKYGSCVHEKLAKLAVVAGLGDESLGSAELAERFISAIEAKNRMFNLPDKVEAIYEEDIPEMAAYADKEANPLYPVPILWDQKQLAKIYKEVMA